MDYKNISIIIPCYNESSSIENTIEQLKSDSGLRHCDIIVIDDGSTDGSGDILSKLDGIYLIKHRSNRGYGSSIATGCKKAETDFIVWMDADGQHQVKDVKAVADKIVKDDFDFVIGCRTKESHQVSSRKFGKQILKMFVVASIGNSSVDYNSGLRGFKTSVLRKYLSLLEGGFGASTTTTLLMYKRKYIGSLVPIDVKERLGVSSVRQVRDGMRTLMLISRITLMFSPLIILGSIGLFQFILGFAYGLFKAIIDGSGFPTFGLLLSLSGIQTLFLGFVLDQVSQIRLDLLEK